VRVIKLQINSLLSFYQLFYPLQLVYYRPTCHNSSLIRTLLTATVTDSGLENTHHRFFRFFFSSSIQNRT